MALTNFQRLWGCENHKTFSWRKNDRAFYYSFMALGVNLHHYESDVGLLGIHTKIFAHYCKTTSDRRIMELTEGSKVKQT